MFIIGNIAGDKSFIGVSEGFILTMRNVNYGLYPNLS